MTKQTIRLGDIEAAKEFVRAATGCNFDIDVYFNKVVLDAKSILGILSIDHRNPITVQYDGYNERFSGLLERYAVN
ncbi:MAG TPA: HPr family phosphocarrier protein [Candidatus Scybalocola faecigallinarum]|uniref:HPr family phosphocarrier protein n=1 Tax=Candidatus Scybalocola faecigallinarum TaxID=2840941 RepID=A0A9D1JRT5_9FIRM|nr:HPr family phosphocarrier protein [Candidatus Scybalocola faecigallinarum]